MPLDVTIPGVYQELRPRPAGLPLPRTDVAGFIGLERRVRDGSTPCRLLTAPGASLPSGHAFQVDVATFQVTLDGARRRIPAARDLVLSASAGAIPMVAGGSITYALAAIAAGAAARLIVVAGAASASPRALAPDDGVVAAAAGAPMVRIADVRIRRAAGGDQAFPIVLPRLPIVRCDDWDDFELALGPLGDPDGSFLARAVRAFFSNGGRRCWVAAVRRPRRDDPDGLAEALDDMVGLAGASETEATGLERLLLVSEVAVVDAPDLYARRADPTEISTPLPPRDLDACFRRCDRVVGIDLADVRGESRADEPVFSDAAVLATQREMIARIALERWRALLLVTAPVELDPAEGRFAGPSAARALAWRQALIGAVDDEAFACVAFYFPWLLAQDSIGAPVVEMPPTPFAAGVIARRDRARGPHISPANETVRGVVALTRPIDDDAHQQLYATPAHINVIRPFPGYGIQIWGARTLSAHPTLRYLAARRCLSAIERRAAAAFRRLVFEPNTSMLWFQITHVVLGILAPLFQAGALAGDTPEQAFYVRCDDSTNPPDQIETGRVLCEVGVALAAPAEFLVFRLSRAEAAVEVAEAS